ncbi:MAG: hypothetical protein F4099_05400, partial [Synechococcus sp. SB0673_bin_10]|nr:hypothetical protein [Synechococcus sp. SB0673_bin_10]
MATFKLVCTLACLAALFLAAPLEAQEARSHLSSDPRINHAGTLIQADRFTEALSILRPLASSDHPDQVDVLFLVGLAALGAAQSPETPESERKGYLDEAIAAFHKILVGRPELARVRLELARAFYVKGETGCRRSISSRCWRGIRIRRWLATSGDFLQSSGGGAVGKAILARPWLLMEISMRPPMQRLLISGVFHSHRTKAPA